MFFGIAGLLALLIRIQLASPDQDFITGDKYNELFTVHGTAMVFLVVVPILAGFGNYLVPLMIGARDMAFPKLNALSYWLFLLGGLVLWQLFAKGGASSAGWTAYPRLKASTAPATASSLILSPHLLSLSSLAGAINFAVTILNMRTRGMTFMRMPPFIWAVYALMPILILPVLSGGLTLFFDRQLTTLLRARQAQRAAAERFWFFGTEVYVMTPAFDAPGTVRADSATQRSRSRLGIAFRGDARLGAPLLTVGTGPTASS